MKNITSYIFVFLLCFLGMNTISATSQNLALGKAVWTKVNNSIGAPSNEKDAGLLVDGDPNTFWESANSFKHSIVIDLGSKYKSVNKIVIKWHNEQAANTVTIGFGDTKESLVQVSSNKDLTEKIETVLDKFDESARFVEILLHGRMDSSKPYAVKEIEIYGEENMALSMPVEARVSSMTGGPSNQDDAYKITDGDAETYWESPASFKHSVLIDLGEKKKITRVVIKWADECASSSVDLSFGETTSSMVKVWSRNGLTETVESVFENLDEDARYFELVVRGRLQTTYRISEIEIYDDNANKHINTPEEQASLDKITQRLIDRVLTTTEAPTDGYITNFYNTMLDDGSWADVDYDDVTSVGSSWSPLSHLNRLRIMAVAYHNPEGIWYNSAPLVEKIEKGLLFYKYKLPKADDNWWYNEIGGPQVYMIPVLLLKGKISETNMPLISSYLKDKIDNYMGEAKNLSWIANIAMHKGCAEDNFSIVSHAFDAFASTLSIVTVQGEEGIKIDGSFHQHHSQLYSGGYGSSLIGDIIQSQNLCEGTLFMGRYTPDKMEIFRNFLDGNLLLSYRHTMDFGVIGRNISRKNESNGYRTISETDLNSMIINDPEKAADYQDWLDHITNNTPFPKSGVNKHFWKSDMMTNHGDNYYLSAKVISNRTYGTECLNGENTKGFNLPMGATNILTSGYEYEYIYPVWDWTRIPGTTAIQNQDAAKLDGYVIGSNEFGGGVSNDVDGIMAYKHDYKGLKAQKSYFMMDDMMLCLGSGISIANSDAVATSVNQSLLFGDVVINAGSEQTLSNQSSQTFNNLSWVHHDNVGYIFPTNADVTVQNVAQSGSWRDINITGNTAVENKDVFSVWLNHGTTPNAETYQYIVAPDMTLDAFKPIASNHGFIVVQNDESVQAIRKDSKYGIVFYQPATVTMDDGLMVSSDKKAIVIITNDEDKYDISVSDPTHGQNKITLTINKDLDVATFMVDEDENTDLEFTLPTGDYTGSTLTKSFVVKSLVSVSENKLASASYVYYDINQQVLQVNMPTGQINTLEVIDLNGKLISRRTISEKDTKANVDLLDKMGGVYFVKLTGQHGVQVLKFMIPR